MVTHPSFFFSTSKSRICAPLLQGSAIHRAAVSSGVVCRVLSGMVLVRLIDDDARAGFPLTRCRKDAHCSGRTYLFRIGVSSIHRSRWRIEFDDGSLSWYERQVGTAVLDCVEWPHHPNEIFDRESNKTKFSILTIMPCAATALSPIGYIQRLSRV